MQEVATIKEAIRDTGRISGGFSEQQTQDLAMILRSGALPAGIKYLEERTVGPRWVPTPFARACVPPLSACSPSWSSC